MMRSFCQYFFLLVPFFVFVVISSAAAGASSSSSSEGHHQQLRGDIQDDRDLQRASVTAIRPGSHGRGRPITGRSHGRGRGTGGSYLTIVAARGRGRGTGRGRGGIRPSVMSIGPGRGRGRGPTVPTGGRGRGRGPTSPTTGGSSLTATIGPTQEGRRYGAISGNARIVFAPDSSFTFTFDLNGIEPSCVNCGIHVHSGYSCSDREGHFWNSSVLSSDVWTIPNGAVYSAMGGSYARGSFQNYNGYDASGNANRVVVVHASDGTEIGCGILYPSYY